MQVCRYIRTYVCMYAYVFNCIYLCMYVCTHVCMTMYVGLRPGMKDNFETSCLNPSTNKRLRANPTCIIYIYIYIVIYICTVYIVNAACHLLGNKFINKSQFEAQRRWGNRISQTRSAFTGSPSKWALESTLNLPHIRSSWFCETNVLLSLGSVRNGLDLV